MIAKGQDLVCLLLQEMCLVCFLSYNITSSGQNLSLATSSFSINGWIIHVQKNIFKRWVLGSQFGNCSHCRNLPSALRHYSSFSINYLPTSSDLILRINRTTR